MADFPEMPETHFPEMKFPDEEELRSYAPDENEKFVASSSSSFIHSSNVNGLKASSGGSHILVNNNGKVDEEKVNFNEGDLPNDDVPNDIPKKKDSAFKIPKIKKIQPFSKPIFPKIKPIHIEPVNIESHVPEGNEHFVDYSNRVYSQSSNINGEKSSSGGSDTVLNVDGKTDKESVRFKQGDEQSAEKVDDTYVADE